MVLHYLDLSFWIEITVIKRWFLVMHQKNQLSSNLVNFTELIWKCNTFENSIKRSCYLIDLGWKKCIQAVFKYIFIYVCVSFCFFNVKTRQNVLPWASTQITWKMYHIDINFK